MNILAWLKEYGAWVLEIVKEYGKKSVFFILLITAIIVTIAYVVDNKIKETVPETIEETINSQNEEHSIKLIETQETYVAIKRKLRNTVKDINCAYIYLVEYHNGNENIASRFPFYKFDVTMDVYNDGVPYVDISTLKDEHIYKYDIFDNEEFTENQFAYCTIEEFENIDHKLFDLMQQNPKIKYIYTYNLYYQGDLMGACMILSYDEIDIRLLINDMHEIERMFNNNIY